MSKRLLALAATVAPRECGAFDVPAPPWRRLERSRNASGTRRGITRTEPQQKLRLVAHRVPKLHAALAAHQRGDDPRHVDARAFDGDRDPIGRCNRREVGGASGLRLRADGRHGKAERTNE